MNFHTTITTAVAELLVYFTVSTKFLMYFNNNKQTYLILYYIAYLKHDISIYCTISSQI